VVAGQKILLSGAILAVGGHATYGNGNIFAAPGSGGAIKCVSDTIAGSGSLYAPGGSSFYGIAGGDGRIRLEANTLTLSTQSSPNYTLQQPLGPDGVVIWPPAPEPTLKITSINGQPVTGDPHMDAQALASGDLVINNTSLVKVRIAAKNLPLNATITVRVVLGLSDAYTTLPGAAQLISGDATSSVWEVELVALSPERVSAIQAKAVLP
jgi:hypothetical protein